LEIAIIVGSVIQSEHTMSNIDSQLTAKQQNYFSIIQQATTEGISVREAARLHSIDPSLLYAARKSLRAKGVLPDQAPRTSTGFATVPLPGSAEQHIELRTQLPNGQPIWLSMPPTLLAATLKALAI
jgi:transposase-like protein